MSDFGSEMGAAVPNDGDPHATRLQQRRPPLFYLLAITMGAILVACVTLVVLGLLHVVAWRSLAFLFSVLGGLIAVPVLTWFGEKVGEAVDERLSVEAARARVRQADDLLASALRGSPVPQYSKQLPEDSSTTGPESAEREAHKPSDDRLALAALWTVTHERLDLYHRIATGQARRSFVTAQLLWRWGLLC